MLWERGILNTCFTISVADRIPIQARQGVGLELTLQNVNKFFIKEWSLDLGLMHDLTSPVFLVKMSLNPNPHCFKAITKATACGWKELLLSHPLPSTVGVEGEGDTCCAALKICLVKTWVTFKLSSKANGKLCFCVKPCKPNSLLRYFTRHF
jgi:hypothetical protein